VCCVCGAGEYAIHVALRHDDVATLKALFDLPIRVEKALDSDLSLPVFTSLSAALQKGSTQAKEFALRAGERCGALASACRLPSASCRGPGTPIPCASCRGPVIWRRCSSALVAIASGLFGSKADLVTNAIELIDTRRAYDMLTGRFSWCRRKLFLGPLPDSGLPKDAKPGCSLAGTLKLARTSPTAGDKAAPGAAPLLVTVPPPGARKDESGNDVNGDGTGDSSDAEKGTPDEALRAARRDADVRMLCLHTLSAAVDSLALTALAPFSWVSSHLFALSLR
jgi:Tripeptidyl peptidase II